MTSLFRLANGELDTHPLALNPWNGGENSFLKVQGIVEERVNAAEHTALIKHDALKKFATIAILSLLSQHTNENHEQFLRFVEAYDSDAVKTMYHFTSGEARPDELVNFLNEQPALSSIETARYTHPGEWNVAEAIDIPTRQAFEDNDSITTIPILSGAHFKPKQFDREVTNPLKAIFPLKALIDRKEIFSSHFNEKIFTVVRRSLLIHDMDNNLPSALRASFLKQITTGETDGHAEALFTELEEYTADMTRAQEQPEWIVPLATTYYSYKKKD